MNSQIENTKAKTQISKNVYLLVVTAIFIALTLVSTMFINIRLPFMGSGGLIHLGNIPLFIAAMLYGRKTGAIVGAIGMGTFDIMSGWVAWAPFTFVIVGLMGYIIGLLYEKKPIKNAHILNIFIIFIAVLIKVIGYYFAEVLIYSNWILPLGSIPGNILQVTIAGIIITPIIDRLKKYTNK